VIPRLKSLSAALLFLPLTVQGAGSFYGYLTTTDGNLARDTYGGCIKTGYWEEKGRQPTCNDELERIRRYVAADVNWNLSSRLPEFVSDFFERYGKPVDYRPSNNGPSPFMQVNVEPSGCVIHPGYEVDIGKIESTALCEYSVAVAILTGLVKSPDAGHDALYLLEEAASKNFGPAINLIGYMHFYGFYYPQDQFSSGWNFSKAEEAGSYEGSINAERLKAYDQVGRKLPSMNYKQDMNIFIIPDIPTSTQPPERKQKNTENSGTGSGQYDASGAETGQTGSVSSDATISGSSSHEDSNSSSPNGGIRVKMY